MMEEVGEWMLDVEWAGGKQVGGGQVVAGEMDSWVDPVSCRI